MTTFNGAMRSIAASARRAEKANQRRTREAAKLYKIQQKQQELESAIQAYENYIEYIDVIQSVHKGEIENIDWSLTKKEPEPIQPILRHHYETAAKHSRDTYVPSFFDKLFGKTKSKIQKLDWQLLEAISKDKAIHESDLKRYNDDLKEWNKLQLIAQGVLNQQTDSYRDALEYLNPFSEISELGSNLKVKIEKNHIIVDIYVNNDDIIPNYIISLTATGKLSRKNMPISRFNELYQDHICSAVLRVARESIANLPIKFVIVNAIGNLLSTKTGRVEEQAILSVAVYPESFKYINFDSVDPSDCMSNFIHNMKFSKTTGFNPIDRIDPMNLTQ